MKEIACEFGERGRLKGILTLPAIPGNSGLALVLVSAGLTAKTGPYRLYTECARELAGRGFATLRFDLGGIGLSQIDSPGLPLPQRTEQDIREALAFLASEHGVSHFVVGGLCSGAEDAFRYAEGDDRVRGVVLIDPHAYETAYWRIRGFFTRYTANRIVYRILRSVGAVRVAGDGDGHNALSVEGFEGKLIDYQYMNRQESTRILGTLLDRGVRVHYVYTGGSIDTFHAASQFPAMFPDLETRGRVAVDFLPYIEHVQIFGEDRALLVDTVVRQFKAAFGGAGHG